MSKTNRQKSGRGLIHTATGLVLVVASASLLLGVGLYIWMLAHRGALGRVLPTAVAEFLLRQRLTQRMGLLAGHLLGNSWLAPALLVALAPLLGLLWALWRPARKDGRGRLRSGRAVLLVCSVGLLLCSLLACFGALLAAGLGHALAQVHVGGGYEGNYQTYTRVQAVLGHDEQAAGLVLAQIMREVEEDPGVLEGLDDEAYMEVGELVCLLIDVQGGVLTPQQHYFRNHFSRAPGTLEEMVAAVQNGNPFGWRLVPAASTYLHMMGPDGEYNLKFVSANGHFEAVYDKSGTLLTQETNPLNMGTFNYASPFDEGKKHTQYDVETFYRWNNAPGMAPVDAQEMQKMADKYAENPGAAAYREPYEQLLCQGV